MNKFRMLALHIQSQMLGLLRVPSFLVPTLLFPTMFFVLFALSLAKSTPAAAGPIMLAYVAFAIIGVTLFQFGVGVAVDRVLPWERYIRTLSAPISTRFTARVIVAMLFALCASVGVVLVASLTTAVHFDAIQWLRIGLCTLLEGIPFTLFGVAIGYWTAPKAALPIANICYLLLSFAGGLWIPPAYLPHFAQVISPYTPTRQFANLLWSAPNTISVHALSALALFAACFAVIAAVGYRRDERARYG